MSSLKFKRLVLISDTTKSANQFTFQDRYNLITGKNNSIGKSSLIKSIFWAIGCDPEFDVNWKSLDCKVLLEFSVKSKNIKLVRVNNSIFISDDGANYQKFGKITGEYSRTFSALVNFKATLPNRSETPTLEAPPPAYYFLPFYIDQLRSWSSLWNSFDNLHQFANWKNTIIKYHTGYLSPKYFELEEEIFNCEHDKREADEELKKINTTIQTVEKYNIKSNKAITAAEFDAIIFEIKNELESLSKEQEELFDKLSQIQSHKNHLETQLIIARKATHELEEDYKFSVENIEGDKIECPLCGTIYDNSILSRSSLLLDKQQAEAQISSISSEIISLSQMIDNIDKRIGEVRQRIIEINKKYDKDYYDNHTNNYNDILNDFICMSITNNFKDHKIKNESLYKNKCDIQKKLKRNQTRLLPGSRKQELSNIFLDLLSIFISKLNAKGVNLSMVKHPTDYKKLYGSGGTAEGARAILAYQMAIFRQIYIIGNEIPAPFVIDTPNQQEQAKHNYESIIKLIMEDTPNDSQILLCCMDNDQLSTYKSQANIIHLDENKILDKKKYNILSEEISFIQKQAIITPLLNA